MKTFTQIAFLFLGLIASGQATDDREKITDIFTRSRKIYETTPLFTMDTQFTMYATSASNQVTEQYTGTLIKSGEDFYSKINKTEFIKIKDNCIKIDNTARLMEVGKAEDIRNFKQAYDLSGMMSYFEKFNLEVTDEFYICTLTAPKISFIAYGKMIIYIRKKDYSISKQVMYSLQQHEYRDANKKKKVDFPRLEIVFSNFSSTNVTTGNKFSLSTYVRTNNKKTLPSLTYKDYKIVD